MRWNVSGHKTDVIEVQRRASRFSGIEVTAVNWIERAAKHSDPAPVGHASRRVRDGVIKSISSEAGGCA